MNSKFAQYYYYHYHILSHLCVCMMLRFCGLLDQQHTHTDCIGNRLFFHSSALTIWEACGQSRSRDNLYWICICNRLAIINVIVVHCHRSSVWHERANLSEKPDTFGTMHIYYLCIHTFVLRYASIRVSIDI